MKWRGMAAGVALATGAMLAGYGLRRALADGIPQTNPMYYSGYLEDNGTPVSDGARNVTVLLWDAEVAGSVACTTAAPGTMFEGGHFRVALAAECVAAVRAHPDLWLEVQVDGALYGRSHLGAVPYAVEAARAGDIVGPVRESLVPAGTVAAFAG